MRTILSLILFGAIYGFVGAIAARADQVGFVNLPNGHKIHVNYVNSKAGKPTLVLLNGLTYEKEDWDQFAERFVRQGYGVVRFDFFGMGQTLIDHGPILDVIPYQDQVEDVELLLDALKINDPVDLVCLSYGGGIGTVFATEHPQRVRKLVLISSFVHALQHQDAWVRGQITYLRMMQPWNPATDDELYDYFLRMLIYSSAPYHEPSVFRNPYKLEAVYRLTQGIRKLNIIPLLEKLDSVPMHMIVSVHDQYLINGEPDELWQAIPASNKQSRILLEEAEHKSPSDKPAFVSRWVQLIIDGDHQIVGGATFEGVPSKGSARNVRDHSVRFKMPKE